MINNVINRELSELIFKILKSLYDLLARELFNLLVKTIYEGLKLLGKIIYIKLGKLKDKVKDFFKNRSIQQQIA